MESGQVWCQFPKVFQQSFTQPQGSQTHLQLIATNETFGIIAIAKGSCLNFYETLNFLSDLENDQAFKSIEFNSRVTHVYISKDCSTAAIGLGSALKILNLKEQSPLASCKSFDLDSPLKHFEFKQNLCFSLQGSGKLEVYQERNKIWTKENIELFTCFKTEPTLFYATGREMILANSSNFKQFNSREGLGQVVGMKEVRGNIVICTVNDEVFVLSPALEISFKATSGFAKSLAGEGLTVFFEFFDERNLLIMASPASGRVVGLLKERDWRLVDGIGGIGDCGLCGLGLVKSDHDLGSGSGAGAGPGGSGLGKKKPALVVVDVQGDIQGFLSLDLREEFRNVDECRPKSSSVTSLFGRSSEDPKAQPLLNPFTAQPAPGFDPFKLGEKGAFDKPPSNPALPSNPFELNSKASSNPFLSKPLANKPNEEASNTSNANNASNAPASFASGLFAGAKVQNESTGAKDPANPFANLKQDEAKNPFALNMTKNLNDEKKSENASSSFFVANASKAAKDSPYFGAGFPAAQGKVNEFKLPEKSEPGSAGSKFVAGFDLNLGQMSLAASKTEQSGNNEKVSGLGLKGTDDGGAGRKVEGFVFGSLNNKDSGQVDDKKLSFTGFGAKPLGGELPGNKEANEKKDLGAGEKSSFFMPGKADSKTETADKVLMFGSKQIENPFTSSNLGFLGKGPNPSASNATEPFQPKPLVQESSGTKFSNPLNPFIGFPSSTSAPNPHSVSASDKPSSFLPSNPAPTSQPSLFNAKPAEPSPAFGSALSPAPASLFSTPIEKPASLFTDPGKAQPALSQPNPSQAPQPNTFFQAKPLNETSLFSSFSPSLTSQAPKPANPSTNENKAPPPAVTGPSFQEKPETSNPTHPKGLFQAAPSSTPPKPQMQDTSELFQAKPLVPNPSQGSNVFQSASLFSSGGQGGQGSQGPLSLNQDKTSAQDKPASLFSSSLSSSSNLQKAPIAALQNPVKSEFQGPNFGQKPAEASFYSGSSGKKPKLDHPIGDSLNLVDALSDLQCDNERCLKSFDFNKIRAKQVQACSKVLQLKSNSYKFFSGALSACQRTKKTWELFNNFKVELSRSRDDHLNSGFWSVLEDNSRKLDELEKTYASLNSYTGKLAGVVGGFITSKVRIRNIDEKLAERMETASDMLDELKIKMYRLNFVAKRSQPDLYSYLNERTFEYVDPAEYKEYFKGLTIVEKVEPAKKTSKIRTQLFAYKEMKISLDFSKIYQHNLVESKKRPSQSSLIETISEKLNRIADEIQSFKIDAEKKPENTEKNTQQSFGLGEGKGLSALASSGNSGNPVSNLMAQPKPGVPATSPLGQSSGLVPSNPANSASLANTQSRENTNPFAGKSSGAPAVVTNPFNNPNRSLAANPSASAATPATNPNAQGKSESTSAPAKDQPQSSFFVSNASNANNSKPASSFFMAGNSGSAANSANVASAANSGPGLSQGGNPGFGNTSLAAPSTQSGPGKPSNALNPLNPSNPSNPLNPANPANPLNPGSNTSSFFASGTQGSSINTSGFFSQIGSSAASANPFGNSTFGQNSFVAPSIPKVSGFGQKTFGGSVNPLSALASSQGPQANLNPASSVAPASNPADSFFKMRK